MLYEKYVVSKKGKLGEKKSVDVTDVDSPFVLMPRKDPSAILALERYVETCEPELGEQIRRWLKLVKSAPEVLGTQGKRNKPFVKQWCSGGR